jgi:hypothetical protein
MYRHRERSRNAATGGVIVKWTFTLISIGCLLFGTLQSQATVGANTVVIPRRSIQSSDSKPTIHYAEWIGKTLRVQGENFAEGALVFVDGQRLKTSNTENFPRNYLLSKKARKKVAPNQAIELQVQNPDGELSNVFSFYSGLIVTNSYYGSWYT